MAQGVSALTALNRVHLQSLEEMAYGLDLDPGKDMSFAGIRVAVEQSAAAAALLRELVPHELAFRAWLAERRRTI